jgi:hypothetical protein
MIFISSRCQLREKKYQANILQISAKAFIKEPFFQGLNFLNAVRKGSDEFSFIFLIGGMS